MTHSIVQLLSMPEGKTLEFKRDLSSPINILKTLVAFANTSGGRLFVVVEDGSGEVLGVESPLNEEERLCNMIADNIEPRLVPNVELISFEDKTLMGVEVYPSGSRPHWIKKEGVEVGWFMSGCVLLTERRTGNLLQSLSVLLRVSPLMNRSFLTGL